ncbi:MAG: CoA transferase [Phenylobacterium sp.]|nr:CoA transferase [Phenylobacterium sp.]
MEPFAGLRVLDLSRSQAGAQTSQLLADFGAEVVLVEPPGGSPLREAAAFPFWARGKKSVALDLHAPHDRLAIARLAGAADVLIESFRPGALDALGLGYEALSAENPGLVYASLTGFGRQGPYARAPGYEGLVLAKLGVFRTFAGMSLTPDRPAFVTVPFASFAAAQVALQGILAALHEREASGHGDRVEASLAQSFLALDTWAWIEHVLAKRWPDALKSAGNFDAQGRPQSHLTFRLLVALTADGDWLQFACTAPKLFAAEMRALGLDWMFSDPEWAGVPKFEDPAKGMDLWTRMLNAAGEKSSADWDAIFQVDHDVFAERFRAGAAILEHPQLAHDGMSLTLRDPDCGLVRQPAALVTAAASPAQLRPAPRLDADRDQVLGQGWAAPPLPRPDPASPPPVGLPLAGVTIVEFASMFAAPQGPALLSELGVRVIKIEPIEGDPIRNLITLPETGGTRVMMGKESIRLDLSKPEGREIARTLCAQADVVLQGFRAGAMERLGLDYAAIRHLKPDIIFVNAPGYGVDGPYGHRPAYAPSIGAAAGFSLTNLGVTQVEQREMNLAEIQSMARRLAAGGTQTSAQADGNAAVAVATAIAFGIYARDRGAGGQELFTSMLNSGAHTMSAYAVTWPGSPPPPTVDAQMRGLTALYRMYDAAEGLVFVAAPSDRDFRRLAEALGRLELGEDPRFATRAARQAHDDELTAVLAEIFAGRSASDWEADLLDRDVGCVEVTASSMEAVLIDTPLGRESGYIVDVIDPTWDETPRQAPLVRLGRLRTRAEPSVLAGQHTDKILEAAGLGGQIARLRAEGVVA